MNSTHFSDLPAEMHEAVFSYFNDLEIANYRLVCRHWKTLLESLYPIYLQMGNDNYEDFVKNTTAKKIRLLANDVTFPIYQFPQFPDFAQRIKTLELTGFIPLYNLVNIIYACKSLNSLVVQVIRVGDGEIPYPTDVLEGKELIQVKKLNICPHPWELLSAWTIVDVLNVVGKLLKANTVIELNLSSEFALEIVVNALYDGSIIENTRRIAGADASGKYKLLMDIIHQHSSSLQKIAFNFEYDVLPKYPETYIEFHPPTPNQRFGIRKSNVFQKARFLLQEGSTNLFREYLGINEMLLLYRDQSAMQNLRVIFRDDGDVRKVEEIIRKNALTLEQISIRSFEVVEPIKRRFDAAIFTPCHRLTSLILKSGVNSNDCQLLHIENLPHTLTTLILVGFIPSFAHMTLKHGHGHNWGYLPNFTKLILDQLPWFVWNGVSVRVLMVDHLRFLIQAFQKLTQLTLKSHRVQTFLTLDFTQMLGYPFPEKPISDELVVWCQNGGDNGNKLSIKQIEDTADRIAYTIFINASAKERSVVNHNQE